MTRFLRRRYREAAALLRERPRAAAAVFVAGAVFGLVLSGC